MLPPSDATQLGQAQSMLADRDDFQRLNKKKIQTGKDMLS